MTYDVGTDRCRPASQHHHVGAGADPAVSGRQHHHDEDRRDRGRLGQRHELVKISGGFAAACSSVDPAIKVLYAEMGEGSDDDWAGR